MNPTTPLHCQTCASKVEGFFCDLGKSLVEELNQAKTCNIYRPHQIIIYEGNRPLGIYCIAKGKVKISKTDSKGHQQILSLAGPGDAIGYRALLADQPYIATAETIEDAQICFIDKRTFLRLLEQHPTTAFRLMQVLAKKLGNAEESLITMIHKNVRERLAELFLVLCKKYGENTTEGIRLNLSLTRQEIADLIGTTQESAIRLMSEFRQEGLIDVKKRQITLLDLPKLADTADIPI